MATNDTEDIYSPTSGGSGDYNEPTFSTEKISTEEDFDRKDFNRKTFGVLHCWTNHLEDFRALHFADRTFVVFLSLQFCVVQFCCGCPVKYLFLFVIYFFLLGGLQLTRVPDRPHWERNGKRKERTKPSCGGGHGF